MISSPLFMTARREVSQAAEAALAASNFDPETFFVRHERGDWGDVEEWLRSDNNRAACRKSDCHAIRSYYKLDEQRELVIVTSPNRLRTRLMLTDEFTRRDVSVQEGYAIWAASYDAPNPLIDVEEPVVDAILAALPPIKSAIDVGTGTGRIARKLARQGVADVLGVDATPEMLAVARDNARREELHNLRFEHAVIGDEGLPAASDTFDLLTCGLMLCHLPDLRRAITECVRVVRPGGRLLLTDFHPATSSFGWRTDHVTPDGVLLLPNTPNTRSDYLDALTESGCALLEAHDIALNGTPYGDISDAAMKRKGMPPLCLVVYAQKDLIPALS